METRNSRQKIFMDIAAEMNSADSLSFSGLVCLQDQHQHSRRPNTRSPPIKEDPEFEFHPTAHPNNNNNTPAATTLSNTTFLQTFSWETTKQCQKASSNNYGDAAKISDHRARAPAPTQAQKASSSGSGCKLFQSCRKSHAIEPERRKHT